jgi:hypothetical protein
VIHLEVCRVKSVGTPPLPTVAQALAFLANLMAFTACVALAFYRNIDGLFHGLTLNSHRLKIMVWHPAMNQG